MARVEEGWGLEAAAAEVAVSLAEVVGTAGEWEAKEVGSLVAVVRGLAEVVVARVAAAKARVGVAKARVAAAKAGALAWAVEVKEGSKEAVRAVVGMEAAMAVAATVVATAAATAVAVRGAKVAAEEEVAKASAV